MMHYSKSRYFLFVEKFYISYHIAGTSRDDQDNTPTDKLCMDGENSPESCEMNMPGDSPPR